MLIQRFAAVALGIMMGTSLLLQTGTVLAAKSEAYYTTQKISDYKKGEFAVLADDDVNFRSGPSTTADVLACLDIHFCVGAVVKAGSGKKLNGMVKMVIFLPSIWKSQRLKN